MKKWKKVWFLRQSNKQWSKTKYIIISKLLSLRKRFFSNLTFSFQATGKNMPLSTFLRAHYFLFAKTASRYFSWKNWKNQSAIYSIFFFFLQRESFIRTNVLVDLFRNGDCCIFSEHLFLRTPLDGCFCDSNRRIYFKSLTINVRLI